MGSLLNMIPGVSALKAGLAVIAIVGAFTAGWKVESWRWGAAETAVAEASIHAIEAETAKDNTASAALVQQEEKARVVTRTITKTVDRIVEKPVYRNVCLDADGLHAANDALAGKATTPGQPDGAVPGAVPAR